MRDKQYTAAIHSYTRAIELDPTVAVYFCNRYAGQLVARSVITSWLTLVAGPSARDPM